MVYDCVLLLLWTNAHIFFPQLLRILFRGLFLFMQKQRKKNYQNITNSGNGFVLTVDTRPPSQTDEHTVNTLKID